MIRVDMLQCRMNARHEEVMDLHHVVHSMRPETSQGAERFACGQYIREGKWPNASVTKALTKHLQQGINETLGLHYAASLSVLSI